MINQHIVAYIESRGFNNQATLWIMLSSTSSPPGSARDLANIEQIL
jgi:hypothetical protein